MLEKARVMEINGHSARVFIKRTGACGIDCVNCKGACFPTNVYVNADNTVGAKPGDQVEIEMQTRVFYNAIILNYGIPLISLTVGMLLGNLYANRSIIKLSSDLISFISGIVFMIIAYICAGFFDKRYKRSGKVTFVIKRIL